jgi:NDP-sugar pyrophosphorylase family protein
MDVAVAGIMAGGQGSRLGFPSKALYPVQGIALIDFVLSDLVDVGVEEVVIAVRPDDAALVAHLAGRRSWFRTVTPIALDVTGTLGAVRALVDHIGDRTQILSTCDVIAPKGALRSLISRHVEGPTEPLMTAMATSHVDDDAPIWIHASDDGVVLEMGKEAVPAALMFGNIRVLGRDLRSTLARMSLNGTTRDSAFMRRLVEENPGRVLAIDLGRIVDVDRAEDAAGVSELVANTAVAAIVRALHRAARLPQQPNSAS